MFKIFATVVVITLDTHGRAACGIAPQPECIQIDVSKNETFASLRECELTMIGEPIAIHNRLSSKFKNLHFIVTAECRADGVPA